MTLRKLLLASAMLAIGAAAAQAAEPDSCKTVRMADVGWSDNTAQNGLFKTVLKGLGYTPEDQVLALPVIIESLKNKDLDIFLDNWMPSNAANVQPYLDAKTIEMLNANLTGAKMQANMVKGADGRQFVRRTDLRDTNLTSASFHKADLRQAKRQLATVIDLNKCVGCQTCTVACKNLWTARPGTEQKAERPRQRLDAEHPRHTAARIGRKPLHPSRRGKHRRSGTPTGKPGGGRRKGRV